MADTTRNIDEILNKLNTLLPQLKLTTDQMNVLKASMEGVGKTFAKDVAAAGDQVKTLNSLLAKTSSHVVESFGGITRMGLVNQLREVSQELAKVTREAQRTKETVGGGATAFKAPQAAIDRLTGGPPTSATDTVAISARVEIGRVLKSQYVSEQQALAALEAGLKKYGMTLENITKVTKDKATGTSLITAQTKEGTVATEQLTLSQDENAKVTARSTTAFKSFGQQLADNIVKVAKWTVAIALVYGPLQQMQEQIGISIENQTEMASIAVVLGTEQEKLAQAFEAVTDAANLTGESIQGVLQGYTQALRATGSIRDETERITTANQLLTDSLILSKLSTLDQAKAMDVLIAALKQSGMELTQGEDLLDKWVAVMKLASVDMRTLAESFAIVGATAKNAGIEVGGTNDELAGLIAVLAQATPLSATQTGNALRAIIAGMTREGTGRELQKFGIAIRNTSGEMRGFFDIANDISKLMEHGLIDEAEVAKLAGIIGGGVRRQGQVEIILKNLSEARRINAETADAQGESDEALTIKTQDLSTAITRLGNAFQELTNTMGTEGGLLDTARSVLEVFTWIIEKIEALASATGKAGPALFAMAAVFGIGRMRGVSSPTGRLGGAIDQNLVNRQGGFLAGAFTQQGAGGMRVPRTFFGRTPGQLAMGVGLSAGLVGLSAASNAREGQGGLAAANVLGGLPGILMGNPMLAVVGSAIAEAIVKGLQDLSGDVGVAFADAFAEQIGPALGDKEVKDEELSKEDIARAAIPSTLGKSFFESFGIEVKEGGFAEELAGQFLISMETGVNDLLAFFKVEGFENRVRLEVGAGAVADIDPEQAQKLYNSLLADLALSSNPEAEQLFKFYGRQEEFGKQFKGQIGGLQEKYLGEVNAQLTAGELSQREVIAKRGTIGGLDATISGLLAGQLQGGPGEDNFIQIGERLLPLADAIEIIAEAYINATGEQQGIITSQIATIKQYEKGIEAAITSGEAEVKVTDDLIISMAAAVKGLKEMQGAQLDYISALSKLQAYANFVPASIQNLGEGVTDLPPDVLALMNQLAPQFQSAYEQQKFRGDQGLIDVYRDTGVLKDIDVQFGKTGTEFETLQGQFDPAPMSRMFQYMKSQGLIPGAESAGANVGSIDLTDFTRGSPEAVQLFADYRQLADTIIDEGGTEDLQEVIAFWDGKVLEKMQIDSSIMQILLRSIRDNTEDMVDGIYNLPSDGTFTVPFYGYGAGFANRSPNAPGGGGYTSVGDYTSVGGDGTAQFDPTDPFGAGANLPSIQTEGEVSRYPGGSFNFELENRAAGIFPKFDLRHPGESFNPEFGGGASTRGGSLESAVDALMSLNEAISSQPIAVNVSITARFTSELDGRVVADETKKFITEDVVRKAGISNINISAAI